MRLELMSADWAAMRGQAASVAGRLVRRMALPAAEHEDLCQDLLVDLIVRLKDYHPSRGSLSAFARVVMRHRAARIAAQLRRERAILTPLSLDHPSQEDGLPLGDRFAEGDGYLAFMGNYTNVNGIVEDRLSLDRALRALSDAHRRRFADLTNSARGSKSIGAGLSRATFYRQLQDLRLCLIAAGVRAGATPRDLLGRPS